LTTHINGPLITNGKWQGFRGSVMHTQVQLRVESNDQEMTHQSLVTRRFFLPCNSW
jgi:hypothetical protein